MQLTAEPVQKKTRFSRAWDNVKQGAKRIGKAAFNAGFALSLPLLASHATACGGRADCQDDCGCPDADITCPDAQPCRNDGGPDASVDSGPDARDGDQESLCTERSTSRIDQRTVEAEDFTETVLVMYPGQTRVYDDLVITCDHVRENVDAPSDWSHFVGVSVILPSGGRTVTEELEMNFGDEIDLDTVHIRKFWGYIDGTYETAALGVMDLRPLYVTYTSSVFQTIHEGDPSCAQVYESIEQLSASFTRCVNHDIANSWVGIDIPEISISGTVAHAGHEAVDIGEMFSADVPHEGETVEFSPFILEVHRLTFDMGFPMGCVSITQDGVHVETERELEACPDGDGYRIGWRDRWEFSDSSVPEDRYIVNMEMATLPAMQLFVTPYRITQSFRDGETVNDGVREWDVSIEPCSEGGGFMSMTLTRRTE